MNVLTRRFGERERERDSLMKHLKPEGSSCPESEQQPNKEMLARMRLADASTAAHTIIEVAVSSIRCRLRRVQV